MFDENQKSGRRKVRRENKVKAANSTRAGERVGGREWGYFETNKIRNQGQYHLGFLVHEMKATGFGSSVSFTSNEEAPAGEHGYPPVFIFRGYLLAILCLGKGHLVGVVGRSHTVGDVGGSRS
jgi:hypothetical protein